jgi:hypothetical protein
MRYILILVLLTTIRVSVIAQGHVTINNPTKGFYFGVATGPSKLAEKAPDNAIAEIKSLFNDLRSGWSYGAEAGYFFNPHFGIGLKYNSFQSHIAHDSVALEFLSTTFYTNISDYINVLTVSPIFYGRINLPKLKTAVSAGFGPSILMYRNIGQLINDSASHVGVSPGNLVSLRIGYSPIKNFQFCIQADYTEAYLKKITDTESQEVIHFKAENYQNISRFDWSAAIIYTLPLKKE